MGEIRFVGTGETRGYPYLVCKKKASIVDYTSEVTTASYIKTSFRQYKNAAQN